jgi:CHAT domain-containing protein
LRAVPFATLHDGKQFLAQKYSSGYAPSLSLTASEYQTLKGSPVLAFGAAEFAEAQEQMPLPAVEIEIPLITQKRGGKFYLNQDFTLHNLTENINASNVPIIHLATHADFEKNDLEHAYIQLYDQKLSLDQLEDFQLHKRNLNSSQKAIELLVISACRSAYGDEEAELGFAGLAVKAGVKTAIASLWYVGDVATLALMSQIYEELGQEGIKAEALRKAQVAMIEGKLQKQDGKIITPEGRTISLQESPGMGKEDLSHPYYWSSFTVIGSPW